MLSIKKSDRAIKIYADINRVCEIEDTVVEWYAERFYDKQKELIDFTFLKDLFIIKDIDYSRADTPVV